jgi:hypothetical protein
VSLVLSELTARIKVEMSEWRKYFWVVNGT